MSYLKTFIKFFFLFILLVYIFGISSKVEAATQRLKVSSNGHYLIKEDGTPFFWLGDTVWSAATISRTEVDTYLTDREKKGFTVIHVDADAYNSANYAYVRPFKNENPDTPDEVNEAWWTHIDYIVNQADLKGIYVCLFTMWGEVQERGKAPYGGYIRFNNDTDKAYRFGKWIGSRYKNKTNIIWSVAGEYDEYNKDRNYALYKSVAQGLEEAHAGTQLMTIHPGAIRSSSDDFHASSWLDFNMLQTTSDQVYASATKAFNLTPDKPKPVVSSEQQYEEALISGERITPAKVRRGAYWAVLAGSFGFTYGHMSVQTMNNPLERTNLISTWQEALNAPAGTQMKYLKDLIEKVSFLTMIPDQSIIASANYTDYRHVQAARDSGGTYALVYIPNAAAVTVNMAKITGGNVNASWYNPRSGVYTAIGTYANSGTKSFDHLDADAEGNDYVLVLKKAISNNAPTGLITNPSQDGNNIIKGSILNFSGTIADTDSTSLTYNWYIDRIGDGLTGALIKSGTQSPGSISGSIVMSGTKINTASQSINLETIGSTYNLSLKVSDGVNTEVEIIRNFILIDTTNKAPTAPTGVRVI